MLACSAGVLLMQANAINSQSFIRPAMFDLQLSGRWGGGERKNVICAPLPLPLSLFLTVDRPLGTNFFLSPAFRCHSKSKMASKYSLAKITPALQANIVSAGS